MKQNNTGYPLLDNPQNLGHTNSEINPFIPNISIYNAVYALNCFYKDKEAINCLDLSVNYGKLFEDSITISRSLKTLGVKKGSIVAISMPNFYQAVAAFLACNRIGAVTTFLNPSSPSDELCEYLNLFESPILINYDKTNEYNENIQNKTKLNYIITLDKKNINNIILNQDYHITTKNHLIDFNSLGTLAKESPRGLGLGKGTDDALILFTSGSTGKPKSVVLTNKNILAAGTYLKNSSNVKSLNGDKTLVCVPFMYPYGFSTSTLITLLSNKTAILAPNLSIDNIEYYMKKEPNIIFGSPALLRLIMQNTAKDTDLSSITTYISGGDFLTPAYSKEGKKFFEDHGAKNVEIGNGSGNAETVSCGTNPVGIEIRPETAGKVLTGTNAMIVDSEKLSQGIVEEKKYGEEGLLCVSGEHVFKEYYKEPKLTANAKFEYKGKTFFKTGTMGFIDMDGYFTLTGRESRFYIISTLNKVYCDHIQNEISNLDEIYECAVVQVPDEKMLYSNKAFIVLKEGYEPSNELIEIIKEKLTIVLKDYEMPKYYEFVNQLPRRTGTEKIDYKLLEEEAKKEINKEKELTLLLK